MALSPLDPAILRFYQLGLEATRLEEGGGRLEALRTRELITRFALPPPATVLDIGGGAGAYGLWLAGLGYSVHLLDLSPRLLAEAQRRSLVQARPLASAVPGDARALPFADHGADIVLLLGPLYHLTDAGDRHLALREARRVLRAGGWLFAAAISRWASLLDGLNRGLLADPRFASIVEQDVQTGQHRNPTGQPEYFTTAYLHQPDELRAEIAAEGFRLAGLFGVEGLGWLLPDLSDRLDRPEGETALLRAARALEAEPAALALSAHWLAVAEAV